jgi:hypothetical protein
MLQQGGAFGDNGGGNENKITEETNTDGMDIWR